MRPECTCTRQMPVPASWPGQIELEAGARERAAAPNCAHACAPPLFRRFSCAQTRDDAETGWDGTSDCGDSSRIVTLTAGIRYANVTETHISAPAHA